MPCLSYTVHLTPYTCIICTLQGACFYILCTFHGAKVQHFFDICKTYSVFLQFWTILTNINKRNAPQGVSPSNSLTR